MKAWSPAGYCYWHTCGRRLFDILAFSFWPQELVGSSTRLLRAWRSSCCALTSAASNHCMCRFPYIRKPSWEPPPWFFGPCWSLLYTLMGVASYLVWKAGTPLSATAFKLYGTQLIFNLAWYALMLGGQTADAPDRGLLGFSVQSGRTMLTAVPLLTGSRCSSS